MKLEEIREAQIEGSLQQLNEFDLGSIMTFLGNLTIYSTPEGIATMAKVGAANPELFFWVKMSVASVMALQPYIIYDLYGERIGKFFEKMGKKIASWLPDKDKDDVNRMAANIKNNPKAVDEVKKKLSKIHNPT